MRIRNSGDRRVPAWAPAASSARTSIRRRSSRAAPTRSATASIATFVPVEGLPADLAPFDVVVANILANPLIALAPALARRLRHGGRIVLSGILDAQADAVIDGVPAVV